ncbi:hypothetical protein BASA60_006024 [Batrachochytrium salamandrivorans]|nr:hypothetical protein BASA60_006024 [Batrachochytrium salamandrivorans]
MRIVHPCSPHTQRCTDMHWPVMTKKLSSKEVRDDDSDLFKVVTAQTIFQGPYNRLFFTVNHEVIGQRLSQDDDDDEQSFIDIFRADLAPPVVHSVQNSNSFRNVNAFLAATKWGSENLDNIAYPASIIVKAIMTWTTDRKRSVQTKLEWPRLFVLEPELQAKPLSIDQHLAAVDAKIEALNSVKSK